MDFKRNLKTDWEVNNWLIDVICKGAAKFKQWCGDYNFEPSQGGQKVHI